MAVPQGMVANNVAGGSPVTFTSNGVEFLRLTESAQDEFVVNETGVDIDTRMEASGVANAFFLQGSDGFIGINDGDPTVRLDVLSGASLVAAIQVGDIATNATRKRSAIVGRHFTNAEEPILMIEVDSVDANTNAILGYGGPNGSYNSVTHHRFYTAANGTTLSGSLRVEIKNGAMVINGDKADYDFAVGSDDADGVIGTDGAGAGFAYFAPDANGARMRIKCASTTVTAAVGATATATNLIPANAKYLGVTTRITTELGASTGTTGYNVGDGTDADRWGTATDVIAGTTTSVPTAEPFGFTAAAANVVLTAVGGNFDGTGVIRVTVHYIDYAGPTS